MSDTKPFPNEAVDQEAVNIFTAFRERVPALRAAGLDDTDMLFVLMEGASRVAAITLAKIATIRPDECEQESFVAKMMKIQVEQAQAALQLARERPDTTGVLH